MISSQDAVDRRITETCNALRSICPDALIEFRQPYSGPGNPEMRQYAVRSGLSGRFRSQLGKIQSVCVRFPEEARFIPIWVESCEDDEIIRQCFRF